MDGILDKAREFLCDDIRVMYTVVALVNEWCKETGGTLDDYLAYLDENFSKKCDLDDLKASVVGNTKIIPKYVAAEHKTEEEE